jgi:hypothetical protein
LSVPAQTGMSVPHFPFAETLLAAFFAVASGTLIAAHQWVSLPFVALFLGGYSYVAVRGIAERLSCRSSVI